MTFSKCAETTQWRNDTLTNGAEKTRYPDTKE